MQRLVYMATHNCLEANSVPQIPMIQVEEYVNSSASENHNSELNKPTKPKTVHQFYFVKFYPFEDPDEASKISEAEKRLQQLEQEAIRINDKCKMLRPAWRFGWSQLTELQNRPNNITSGMEWAKRVLNHLQIALDKLNFANAEPGVVAKKSTFSTNQRTYHGFKRKMLHGSSNLALERKLLKEVEYRSQERQLHYFTAPRPGLTHEYVPLNETWWFNKGIIDKAKYTEMIEKVIQIEVRKEKAPGDATAKGQPSWDPLRAKRAIQEQIKVMNQILLELKRDHCEVTHEIERTMKQLFAFRKDVHVLIEQRKEIRRKKSEAEYHLLILRQQSEEMNRRYQEYLSLCINNARELARKKDVASLTRLSRWQVEKFMSEWDRNKNLRNGYEVSILPSLERRGLSRDGRIKSCDDDTCRGEYGSFTMEGPTNVADRKIKNYMTYDEFN